MSDVCFVPFIESIKNILSFFVKLSSGFWIQQPSFLEQFVLLFLTLMGVVLQQIYWYKATSSGLY